ncbi:MAG: hypothetical protein ACI9VS_002299 [Candidatus Binatia bacterium]|jgi:hypothetical protein
MSRLFISKSKFLSGLQCHKLLWTQYNAKELIPETDAATQAIFDQGHEVGEWAKKLFPGGIEVAPNASGLQETIAATTEALRQRVPLFEAAISAGGGYARADILNPVGDDSWDVYEVKSGTSVKDVNLHDLAFQVFVYRAAGLKIGRSHLVHINNEYVRHGEIDVQQLFVIEDLTDEIASLVAGIEASLAKQQSVIALPESPVVKIGPHCSDPYGCPLTGLCWEFLPEDNVFDLYRGGKKSWSLFDDGVYGIADIGDAVTLNDKQEIQRAAIESGQPHVDKPAIKGFLDRLTYPLYFLDFETFSTAVPMLDGVRPYQQVPFQFSLHIQQESGGELEAHGFLAEGTGDPRPEFMSQLKSVLGRKGDVIAYNASFEVGRLRECAELLPEYAKWVSSMERRIVDLLKPFRAFHYYHPDQHGSASLKAVLPALTGRSYDDLEIKEGGTASAEFMRVTFGDIDEEERLRVRSALETYCALDTEAMVWIVESLKTLMT